MIIGLILACGFWFGVAIWASNRDRRLHPGPEMVNFWRMLDEAVQDIVVQFGKMNQSFYNLGVSMGEAQESIRSFAQAITVSIEKDDDNG